MTYWTPPNRGVTSALTSIPHTSAFPLMGETSAHPSTGSTDGGTLVRRSGNAKSGTAMGGKADRRNVLAEGGGPAGGVRVMRCYTNEAAAENTGRSVRAMPSAFGTQAEFFNGSRG